MFLFVVYLAVVVDISYSALAYSNQPSLQQPKPLCHNREKLALLSFKRSFDLDCSPSYSTSAYPKVRSWHDESDHVSNATVSVDCCRWDGVKCDGATGHVIGLDLSSSCLFGIFPPNSSLFSLDHLLYLNLFDNCFDNSQIPSAIDRLHKLTHLNLSNSVFGGQVPLEIMKLSSLNLLDLSHNHLKLDVLSLEKLVYNLTRLAYIDLSWVDISSTVPHILSNRTSLRAISLDDCNLFGEFPSNIFRLPNLEEVQLRVNFNLRGYLPEFHSNSPLRILSVTGTKFSGELPASIGNLGSLNVLELQNCDFSGRIPSSIGNLTNLFFLTLDTNSWSGKLPLSIMNLTRLSTLGLSNLMCNGPEVLKSWLAKLNSLTQLLLTEMNLGNEILPVVANFTSLTDLDLSNNQIRGPLPNSFMNLTHLHSLTLSGILLQGPIPTWISDLKFLYSIFLNFNGTEGNLDSFLKLPNLTYLELSGISLRFYPNLRNSSSTKLAYLVLDSCNLTKFPEFLRFEDKLQELSLSGNNITGEIPKWFVNLTTESLASLDLSNNLFTGFEKPVTFLPWDNLERLNLNDNKFRGQLMSPPSSMQTYKVSNNQFYGDIPKHICRATSLVYLDLSQNTLSGQIPSCIGNQFSGSLQVLNLRGNKLSGTIPQTFSRSCQLKLINLSENQLDGKLPKSLGSCTSLEVLDVGRNSINDTFPSWLGSLLKLQVLVLRHNNFYGKVATKLADPGFLGLRIIDLSYNFHTGPFPSKFIQSWLAMSVPTEDSSQSSKSVFRTSIPSHSGIVFEDEIYNYGITISNKGSETYYSRILTIFREIDFSSNKLTGSIPEIIGNLRGLQAINLSNNNLVGGIPSSLANITDLESMDLSQNKLSGKIPREFTKLNFLEIFNVSHNQLVGPIPQGQQFSTFDESCFEGNLGLCGAQLSNKCKNADIVPNQPTNEEINEEDSKLIDWIVRSLGCVSGLIVGYVIGKIYVTDKHHDWFMETFGRRGRSKTRVKRSAQRRRSN